MKDRLVNKCSVVMTAPAMDIKLNSCAKNVTCVCMHAHVRGCAQVCVCMYAVCMEHTFHHYELGALQNH